MTIEVLRITRKNPFWKYFFSEFRTVRKLCGVRGGITALNALLSETAREPRCFGIGRMRMGCFF